MFTRRFEIFRMFGFPIRIDLSWFIIAILITWSLATFTFPQWHEGLETGTYWTMGVLGALGLFLSVLLHEFGHALVAQRYGMRMGGITLFIFGGVAEMQDESPSAKVEFWVAIAGPIVSVAIAVVCWLGGMIGERTFDHVPTVAVLNYLALINSILVVFNMIPAFPLDGGRVFRAVLWARSGSLRKSTKIASELGSAFGLGLIVLGALMILLNPIGGIFLVFLGFFLRHAASMSYQQVVVRRALEGEIVRRFMQSDPVTVSPDLTLDRLVEEYIYRHHFKMYPVVDDSGQVVGCITTREVREVPTEQWPQTRVGDIAGKCNEENTVHPGDDAMNALSLLNQTGASRVLVMEGDKLVGVLSLKDLMHFLSLKVELEPN
ncbi:MAG: site-2 protease family protein [Phycisphaerales bacterium]|nr:MAG: site-2 protease family protein [Phycisphaerales bacterium]